MLDLLLGLAAIGLFLLACLLLLGGIIGFANPGSVGAKSRVGALLPSWCIAGVCVVLSLLLGGSDSEPEPEQATPTPASSRAPVRASSAPPPVVPVVSDQWIVESGLAASGGESGRLRIAVGCRGLERFVVIGLADGGSFANERVLARWDDGRDGTYPFVVRGESLVSAAGTASRVRLMIDLLRQRNSVELQVTAAQGGEVTDRVDLSGSSSAINSLSCIQPTVARRPQTQQRAPTRTSGVSMARATASRVQGGLDSPLELIMVQMPDDVVPTRRLSGQNRIFTYTFTDGSQLILTFRPGAPGEGLFLYTVDVR